MSSFITSYAGLFSTKDNSGTTIEKIEIPLIQRDYAQGRIGLKVEQIRSDFLDVLCSALSGTAPVGLDFIYGEVRGGVFRPLDGQQRLTTLFLLHWYVAFRTGNLESDQSWTQFKYATRASAAWFCERIVSYPPPVDVQNPAAWIEDQSWYLHLWRHDPTIQSMRVMIDALDERLCNVDLALAWSVLTDNTYPAVYFHVLPIDEIGAGDELYIKMNSRGKPLTPFENFKARLEKAIEHAGRASEFAQRIDGVWSDIFWRYRGATDTVDDKMMCYFSFVTEISEWKCGVVRTGRLERRAEELFGDAAPNAIANLDFVFQAFDIWVDSDVDKLFSSLVRDPSSNPGEGIPFFNPKRKNLFHECCEQYALGGRRTFGWSETLTLYAILLHQIHNTEDFARRIRVLRNLLDASTNELRLESMPTLLTSVTHLVLAETLSDAVAGLTAFNEAQIDDERAKVSFLEAHPDLTDTVFQLEDHRLLRGSLAAFDLDAARLPARAASFLKLMGDQKLWPLLTAALLATGDYSRERKGRSFRFGSPTEDRWWRELLTGTKRANLRSTSAILETVLDALSASDKPTAEVLTEIRSAWLEAQNSYDWRYYLVKYDAMREGASGIYFAEGGRMGFGLCMLDKTQLNSWYLDPFLHAIWKHTGARQFVQDLWYTSYESTPRWMPMLNSDTSVRCTAAGFTIKPPTSEAQRQIYDAAFGSLGVDERNCLLIPQVTRNGEQVDTEDRIERAGRLIETFAAVGL